MSDTIADRLPADPGLFHHGLDALKHAPVAPREKNGERASLSGGLS